MQLTHDRWALARTLDFIGRHFPTVAVLCTLSAGGRFVQTAWASLSGTAAQVLLEVVVEGARIVLVMAVIGDGNPFAGARAIKRLLSTSKASQKPTAARVPDARSIHWLSYACDFALYCAAVLALNLIIPVVVALPAVSRFMNSLGAEGPGPAVLLWKNFSVIPLTIIFQIYFVLRLLNSGRGTVTLKQPAQLPEA